MIYLTKASFSLAEEIKLYTFMKNQSVNMVERRERIQRLLTILYTITGTHPEYEEYTQMITEIIQEIEKEKPITEKHLKILMQKKSDWTSKLHSFVPKRLNYHMKWPLKRLDS